MSEEQRGLRDLLARIEASPSTIKQAAAWLSEKVGEGKLALASRNHPALATLQGLESLVLGLQGKLGLYRVLTRLAPADPRIGGDFAALADRTLAQQAMVEAERLAAAASAFEASGVTMTRGGAMRGFVEVVWAASVAAVGLGRCRAGAGPGLRRLGRAARHPPTP